MRVYEVIHVYVCVCVRVHVCGNVCGGCALVVIASVQKCNTVSQIS